MHDNTMYISYIIEMGGKIESSRRLVSGFTREHSAILSTFIKLPFFFKIFGLSIFEWLFYTGFTVYTCVLNLLSS